MTFSIRRQDMELGFEKLFIILRTLIIRKTIQCTASHHTFTQQNSVNIIKSDAEHKRLHVKKEVFRNPSTAGTIRRNLQTTTIYHFIHTNSIAHEEKKF
ncbi:hypothetical protein T10_13274 [Trichinella papuae]|uniref:Uncharacterized protein n=1 Tax=Trichinella papuae TaxID=268474 RepID=A0A0V1MXM7_9BILA|nr:hypothetical protein T10_13274 [Trichinella papuae]